MSNELASYLAIVSIVVAVIALVGLIYSALSSKQTINALARKLAASQDAYDAILETNKGLSLGATSLNERLARIEQEFARLHEDVDRISLSEQDSRAFTQAIKLAGKGANVDELVETCELSKGEAELIVLLHSQRTVADDDFSETDAEHSIERTVG